MELTIEIQLRRTPEENTNIEFSVDNVDANAAAAVSYYNSRNFGITPTINAELSVQKFCFLIRSDEELRKIIDLFNGTIGQLIDHLGSESGGQPRAILLDD